MTCPARWRYARDWPATALCRCLLLELLNFTLRYVSWSWIASVLLHDTAHLPRRPLQERARVLHCIGSHDVSHSEHAGNLAAAQSGAQPIPSRQREGGSLTRRTNTKGKAGARAGATPRTTVCVRTCGAVWCSSPVHVPPAQATVLCLPHGACHATTGTASSPRWRTCTRFH